MTPCCPNGFFLDTLPPPLVYLRLVDVKSDGQHLKCIVIPVCALLEALLEDIDLLSGPFAASAHWVATFVDSNSSRLALARSACLMQLSLVGTLFK